MKLMSYYYYLHQNRYIQINHQNIYNRIIIIITLISLTQINQQFQLQSHELDQIIQTLLLQQQQQQQRIF